MTSNCKLYFAKKTFHTLLQLFSWPYKRRLSSVMSARTREIVIGLINLQASTQFVKDVWKTAYYLLAEKLLRNVGNHRTSYAYDHTFNKISVGVQTMLDDHGDIQTKDSIISHPYFGWMKYCPQIQYVCFNLSDTWKLYHCFWTEIDIDSRSSLKEQTCPNLHNSCNE